MSIILRPMSENLLAFYYSLTMYSIGIIISVATGKIDSSYIIITLLVIITPLTLLFTSIENEYIDIYYGLICPLINGIIGACHGYYLKIVFSFNRIKIGNDKLGDIIKTSQNDTHTDKCCCCCDKKKFSFSCCYSKDLTLLKFLQTSVIFLFILLLILTYYVDITMPFYVLWKKYYIIRFISHISICIIIAFFGFLYRKYLFFNYWLVATFSLTTILLTRLIVSAIEYKIWYTFLLFAIHSTICYIIYFMIFFTVKRILPIFWIYNDNNNEFELKQMETTPVNYDNI